MSIDLGAKNFEEVSEYGLAVNWPIHKEFIKSFRAPDSATLQFDLVNFERSTTLEIRCPSISTKVYFGPVSTFDSLVGCEYVGAAWRSPSLICVTRKLDGSSVGWGVKVVNGELVPFPLSFRLLDNTQENKKCTCGAAKCGSNVHSSWCDLA